MRLDGLATWLTVQTNRANRIDPKGVSQNAELRHAREDSVSLVRTISGITAIGRATVEDGSPLPVGPSTSFCGTSHRLR